MFQIKSKSKKQIQSHDSSDDEDFKCDKQNAKCEQEVCVKDLSQSITIYNLRSVADVLKNYRINNDVLDNYPASFYVLGQLNILKEAIEGPSNFTYHPHLLGQKPHCQSICTIKTFFNHLEIQDFVGYFNGLPNNTDWEIVYNDIVSMASEDKIIPIITPYLVRNPAIDYSEIVLSFIHIPFTVCKGGDNDIHKYVQESLSSVTDKEDVILPKCEQQSPSTVSSCTVSPVVPTVPIPFTTGSVKANIDKYMTISKDDVTKIMAEGAGITILFKPQL